MNKVDLKVVTGDTLKELISLDVVTPQMYESLFKSKLRVYDDSYDVSDLSVDSMIQNLETISKIQNETQESAKEIHSNINLAQKAIEKHDIKALEKIKDHMKTLQERISKLENEVYIDALTKVYNRKWLFDKALDDGKFKSDGVLVFIDLDKFKEVNDNYGHLAGDKVLVLIANMLVKISDVNVARFGGDEFVILSEHLKEDQLQDDLDKINKNFETKSLKFKNSTFKISISYGCHPFKKGENFKKIAQVVDEKMYEQKEQKKMLTEEAL